MIFCVEFNYQNITSNTLYLLLKLQSKAQGAEAAAVSSVVMGKEVESETITLHRELESESLLFFYLSNLFIFLRLCCLPCIIVFVEQPTELFFSN